MISGPCFSVYNRCRGQLTTVNTKYTPLTLPPGIPAVVSKHELARLPLCRYEGPIHLVSGEAELLAALEDIRDERVVGFDTETRAAFAVGERYPPAIAQFATAEAVYLFMLRHREIHAGVGAILASGRVIKAGVGVGEDVGKLRTLFPCGERRTVDLAVLARRHGIERPGVRSLAGIFLRSCISKGAQTSNWAARTLTPAQIAYAATDAWVCRELYLRFEALGMVRGAAGEEGR